jgi:XTP/dITP diphosphohydrolase
MSQARKLLIATSNPGKIAELSEMLAGSGIEIIGLNDLIDIEDVEETAATFAANARLKAVGYARQAGMPALADDSGLEVTALGGRPGVFSARYGGDTLPFSEKIEKLLDELAGSTSDDRSARFVCVMSLATPDGRIVGETHGICGGKLTNESRGSGGFGYDPIFVPDGYDETFGELPDAVKAQISHRARAFSQIMPILRRFFSIST